MEGVYLTFFVQEKQRVDGKLAYEWLLAKARELGLPGGSAVRAVAGYGRHGKLHEDHFFELAGDLPVEVSFAITQYQAEELLVEVKAAGVSVFYVQTPARFGHTGPAA